MTLCRKLSARKSVLRARLTSRECEVVRAVADGLTYKEIAHRLGVSFHTVAGHLKSIYRKTGVPGIRRLAAIATHTPNFGDCAGRENRENS